MYHDNLKDLEYALKFTKLYQSEDDISIREAKCLQLQATYILNPINPGDLIVGTMTHGFVGFSPQYGGEYTYYFHDDKVAAALTDPAVKHLASEVQTMRDFWATENTAARMLKRLQQTWDIPQADTYYYAVSRLAGVNVDLDRLVTMGLPGLKNYIKAQPNDSFYTALTMSIDAIIAACHHYQAEATAKGFTEIAEIFANIATKPPATFKEALQLVWIYAVQSGLMNYGRMDNYLGDFYARDIDAGILTEEVAIQWLASLYRNIIIVGKIHDTRIIIGGKHRKNPTNADRLALALIKTSRLHKDTVPQLTLRYHTGINPSLLDQALINIKEGAVYPIIYSDETTIPAVQNIYNIDETMASRWVPFGCGEYVIEGYGVATPNTGAILPQALDKVLKQVENQSFDTFDALFSAYDALLKPVCQMMARHEELNYSVAAEQANYLHHSLLIHDCIETGKPLLSGGARYLAATSEIYGIITAADSFMAIKHCVYDQKHFTITQLATMLSANFVGYEAERKLLQNAPKYGNDHTQADQMAQKVFDHIATLHEVAGKTTNLYTYNICSVNNSGSADFGYTAGASACGRLAGEAFSNGNGPSIGADKNGLTAALNSMAKIDPNRHVGVIHNIRLDKDMLTNHTPQIKTILTAFLENNGVQVNLSAIGKDDLQNALKNPEKYPDLIVRIGGFSARFIELSPIVQKEIVARTTYGGDM